MDIEVLSYDGEGYDGVMEFESWKVAFLNSDNVWTKENAPYWQKHLFTDEVFVLIEGECTLFTAGDGDVPKNFKALKMEKNKVYNVKKSVWHTHTLRPNTKVLIVENKDTTSENSPVFDITDKDREFIREAP